jgi:hypothetical protein
MNHKILFSLAFSLGVFLGNSTPSRADSELEGKFQDMFVTAGYSAAAGAAIGAALLTFQDEPTKNLKFVSIGASLGFLSGTALGSWMVLAPIFVENTSPTPTQLANKDPDSRLVVRPWFDLQSKKMIGLEAGAIFAKF